MSLNQPCYAKTELAAYELNRAQTDTQQGDRRATIRHSSRIRRKTEKLMDTASVLHRKSPVGIGRVKSVTAYDAGASDVKERWRLRYDQ